MSFMTRVKAKYIIRLSEKIAAHDPLLAQELKMLVAGAMNPPHERPTITLGSLSSALISVVSKLEKEKIPFALAGGLAVKYWVDIRETLDIDLVLHTHDIEKVKTLFPMGRDLPLMYTVRIDGTDIDFLKGDLFGWTDEALAHAKESQNMGVQIKILTPEYLVLFKFRAARERDMGDIKGLLSVRGTAEKARHLVNKFMPGDIDDLEQMLRELEFGV